MTLYMIQQDAYNETHQNVTCFAILTEEQYKKIMSTDYEDREYSYGRDLDVELSELQSCIIDTGITDTVAIEFLTNEKYFNSEFFDALYRITQYLEFYKKYEAYIEDTDEDEECVYITFKSGAEATLNLTNGMLTAEGYSSLEEILGEDLDA